MKDLFETRGDRQARVDDFGEGRIGDLHFQETARKPRPFSEGDPESEEHQDQAERRGEAGERNRRAERQRQNDHEDIEPASAEDFHDLSDRHPIAIGMFQDMLEVFRKSCGGMARPCSHSAHRLVMLALMIIFITG